MTKNSMNPRLFVSMRLFVVVAVLTLFVVGTMAHPKLAAAGEAGGKLVVTGRAEIMAEPDMAVFSVGVDTRGETLEEARRENAAAMDGVRKRLLDAGVMESNMKTKGFNVHPEWSYDHDAGTRTLIGYRVMHTLEVSVTELERLGVWLDAAMQEGANQISGPVFGIQDPKALEAEALTEAVRRAREKAEVMARAGGVYLKGISHMSEQVALPIGGTVRAAFMAKDAMESVSTAISPGEISVTATVSITFDI